MPNPAPAIRRFDIMKTCGLFALLPFAFALSPVAAAQDSGNYFRAGLGIDWSGDTHFSDHDCAQTAPPALFGCQDGTDGRPIGAYGDFGRGLAVDAGLGHRFSPRLRGEVLLSYRPGLDFDGNANFLGVSGEQPVSAELDSLAALAVGYLDFPTARRWQPYLGVGVGLARNRIGPVHYAFPGLGETAATRTSGGSDTGLAWMLSAGVAIALSPRVQLDLAYRYSDLGDVRTDSGPATIVRSSGELSLDVGVTKAELAAQGVVTSLRWRF